MSGHNREAARRRFARGSKSMVLPSASSTGTRPGAATMSSAGPSAATLTASGIGRSTSITSCPASRAAVTRSTRSGVRSSSRPRILVWAIIEAGGAESFPFFDVLPRRAEQRPLEVVADQRAARLEQVVEGLQQTALRRLRLAALGLDALPHVAVAEVDCLPRRAVDRRGVVLAQVHQGPAGCPGPRAARGGASRRPLPW